MKRPTAETPTCWGIFREVEHSPGREADDAGILEATGRRLEEAGIAVAYRAPATITGDESALPSLAFSMCERLEALEGLRRWESRGVCVVNSSLSVANTHREKAIALLEERGIPMPESRLLDCSRPLPHGKDEDGIFSACWIKQATGHKTREGDVVFAADPSSVRDALDRLRSRGLPRAVAQRHVEGDLVKFYGVTEESAASARDGAVSASWFEWFYPKEKPAAGHPFDARALRDIACRAARALGLDVWGGDAIVTPRRLDLRDRRQRVAELRALSGRCRRPHRGAPGGPPAPVGAPGRMTPDRDTRARRFRDAGSGIPVRGDRPARVASGAPNGAGGPARRVRPRVRASAPGPAAPVLDGTGARPFPRDDAESALPPGRIVLLPDRAVANVGWLRSLREMPAEPGRLYRLGAGAVVETPEPAPLSRVLARQSLLPSVVSEWTAALPAATAPIEGIAAPVEVTTDAELAAGETFLLNGLVKKEDGILTRLISRKISLAVTRRIASTRITPNAMTLVSVALGLAGAWSFLSPSLPRQIAGGLLFLLHSILDGCDGELARLKFQESRFGGILDFCGDNLVHVCVFSAFGVAWSTRDRAAVAALPRRPGRRRNGPLRRLHLHVRDAAPARRRAPPDDGLARAPVAAVAGPGRPGAPRLHLLRDDPRALREGLLVPGAGVGGNAGVLRGALVMALSGRRPQGAAGMSPPGPGRPSPESAR